MSFHSVACLIPMVKIQELCQSYTSMTEDKWTAWQREWAVMAMNYAQSHWSYWLISQNLRTFSCLQRTWLGQLAVSLSPAEPRICRFCMCGSLNSACTWLIDEICRRVVPTMKFSAELYPPIDFRRLGTCEPVFRQTVSKQRLMVKISSNCCLFYLSTPMSSKPWTSRCDMMRDGVALSRVNHSLWNSGCPSFSKQCLQENGPCLATWVYQNRHHHAAETFESRFMKIFHRELCQRTYCIQHISAIWLHNGIWIKTEVTVELVVFAEWTALRAIFPTF